MENEPHEFGLHVGTATKIVHVSLSNRHEERDILIIDTSAGTVAVFGYFGRGNRWYFMIVPPEFREELIITHLKNMLLRTYNATLCAIPGDTINLSHEQIRALPLYRPPSLHS